MGYAARVVCDSVTEYDDRIITVEATYWRAIHPQMLHHRDFSRGAASNRAMPVLSVLERTMADPALPIWWGKKQKGMQADQELTPEQIVECKRLWLGALDAMAGYVRELDNIGLHKQVTNRLIEPWQFITTIYTGTEWENFFRLRCHKDAQPEERLIATLMRDAIEASVPVERRWHLPYVTDEERSTRSLGELIRYSVARVARVSYLNHDGIPDQAGDLKVYDRLDSSDPPHMGPYEHVARPTRWPHDNAYNLVGWESWRYVQDNDLITADELQQKAA